MIALRREGGMWVADYSAAPPQQRAQLLDLFGDLVLPCAFSDGVPAAEVLATIRRLNPNQAVRIADRAR